MKKSSILLAVVAALMGLASLQPANAGGWLTDYSKPIPKPIPWPVPPPPKPTPLPLPPVPKPLPPPPCYGPFCPPVPTR